MYIFYYILLSNELINLQCGLHTKSIFLWYSHIIQARIYVFLLSWVCLFWLQLLHHNASRLNLVIETSDQFSSRMCFLLFGFQWSCFELQIWMRELCIKCLEEMFQLQTTRSYSFSTRKLSFRKTNTHEQIRLYSWKPIAKNLKLADCSILPIRI